MSQKYKFFVNNKLVFLTTNPALVDEILQPHNEYIIQGYNKKTFAGNIKLLLGNENQSSFVFFYKDLEELKTLFLANFKTINAGGGVVENWKEEVLLIFRRGWWDLPKGKVEENETIPEAAVREVEEETGLSGVELLSKVKFKGLKNDCTYHAYFEDDTWKMKASYWFTMISAYQENLVPQTEEDIEQAIWVEKSMLKSYFPKMYPSIIDVLKESGEK